MCAARKVSKKAIPKKTSVRHANGTDNDAAAVPRISAAFVKIAAALRRDGRIDDASQATRRTFGADALKINGKIFAMPVKGRLVVKLPRERVDGLVASGRGGYFEPGHGRVMKEWISLLDGDDSLSLSREARDFVGAKSRHS